MRRALARHKAVQQMWQEVEVGPDARRMDFGGGMKCQNCGAKMKLAGRCKKCGAYNRRAK